MSQASVRIALVFVCLLATGACAGSRNTKVEKDGAGMASAQAENLALIGVGTFEDRRYDGENWMERSVDTESNNTGGSDFKEVVSEALESRGLLAASGQELYKISGDVLNPKASRHLVPHASIRIRVRVSSLRGGPALYSGVYEGEHTLKGISLWHVSAKEKRGEAEQIALANAVEAAVDDPRLRRVLVY